MKKGAFAIFRCKKTKRVLMGKRKGNNAGQWNFFGGNIDRGEGRLAALKREVEEELGVRIKKKDISHSIRKKTKKRKMSFFVVDVDSENFAPTLNKKEHKKLKWFDSKELPLKVNPPTKHYYKATTL